MIANIHLGAFHGDHRELDKKIVWWSEYSATIFKYDLFTPVLRIHYITDEALNYVEFNQQYYYVTQRYIDKGVVVLELEMDVLMTYNNMIKHAVVIVDSDSSGNPDVPDASIITSQEVDLAVQNFESTPFTSSPNIILVVAG